MEVGMVKKAKLFKGKERKSRAEVSEFFAQLSEKVANGQVILHQVHDDLVLDLPHSMGMKVKVTQKKKRVKGIRHKLTLTLTWTEGDLEDPLALG
jgi:amphi-Trp domain-containing protein